MGRREHDELPPDLGVVAAQLRRHRHEASALELDLAKTRILNGAGGRQAARGERMRKRSLITAAVMLAAVGTGSGAALAVNGSLPFVAPTHHARPTVRVVSNAAAAQYGTHRSRTLIYCVRGVRGRPTTCTAYVIGGPLRAAPTGTVTFTSTGGGAPASCTLVRRSTIISRCSAAISTSPGLQYVTGHYSGDAVYAPSDSNRFPVYVVRRGF